MPATLRAHHEVVLKIYRVKDCSGKHALMFNLSYMPKTNTIDSRKLRIQALKSLIRSVIGGQLVQDLCIHVTQKNANLIKTY